MKVNNWSTIKKVSGIVLLSLGLGIFCWKMFGNKNNKNNHSVTPRTSEKKSKTAKITKKNNQKKNVKKVTVSFKFSKNAFNTADQLVKLVSLTILKENIFTSPVEFLEKLIRYCCLNAKDVSWNQSFPKDENELIETLKKLNLYDQFNNALEEKYKKDLE